MDLTVDLPDSRGNFRFVWPLHEPVALINTRPPILGGGEPNGKFQLFNDPQVNSIVIPIYKNGGKRIFEFGDRLNPPH